MVVFDVDGTLISGDNVDWACFADGFAEAAGFGLTPEFWAGLQEVTSQSVVHQALGGMSEVEKRRVEAKVCACFLDKLRSALAKEPGCFAQRLGVPALLRYLRGREIPVAVATGEWREPFLLKVATAGLDLSGVPFATSSDRYRRADIIALAVERAGGRLDEAVYVGDGPWDLRACRELGIPFIATGERCERLREAGADGVANDLSPEAFLPVWESVRCRKP